MSRPVSPIPLRPLPARLVRVLERFLAIEAASGLVLLLAAAVALLWANSPWAHSYQALWTASVTVGVGSYAVTQPLHFWINDGLMTIFFLLVGLEIRRELHDGALADHRIAVLPVTAALGGVIVPAALYLAVNGSTELRRGWAIPTATDIAFAVGVLSLLGSRVPAALRFLLLTLAIVDDIVAIVIIAAVYSNGIGLWGTAITFFGVAGIGVLRLLGIRRTLPYVVPGAVVWLGLFQAGLHPALAGVILGLLIPADHRRDGSNGELLLDADRALGELRVLTSAGRSKSHQLWPHIRQMKSAPQLILSPVERLEAALHPWVAFGIMPLFALANAGVSLGALSEAGHSPTPLAGAMVGIVLGLVLGKPIGIVLASWIATRLGWCALPEGVGWRHLLVLGALGGIGFTMSIFIANLAFPDAPELVVAKFGVLVASGLAAAGGLLLGRQLLPKSPA